jgi:hypothetical protein
MRCALLKASEIAVLSPGRPLTPTLSPEGRGSWFFHHDRLRKDYVGQQRYARHSLSPSGRGLG